MLLIALILLFLLLVGFGFTIHLLWILAAVVIVALLIAMLTGRIL
jgi:hypothetical protein